MKRNHFHRGMALLLAVCMMLTMNGGFAFAAAAPLPAEASITETTESTESPEASGEATAADDEQEEPADPMGSASEGGTPSLDTPVCTCNPAPGTSSVEGHGADCPLYEEPEPPADEQGECTCPPVDSGEMVHGEDCPLYEAPAEPICLCQPVVEDDGTHTNPDCPLYVVQELPLCTCPEGVVEQFQTHLSDCPLYDGPSEEDYTQEFIIEPDEHMPIETVGEAQTKAARSALAAAPAGQTFRFDRDKSGNLSFARFEEKMPNRPIELVFNIDNFSASSNNILALYLTADVGATFYAELNGTSIGGKQSMTSATKLMLAVPFSTSLLHNGENTVKLRFEGLGDLKCRDARILLSGGEQSGKITKAFELQGFSVAYPASELTLRSEVSDVSGQVGFQYIGGGNYNKVRTNNVNGSKSFTDTVEFLNTSGLQCQLFVNDGTNYVAYRTKVYQLNYNGAMDWLAVASEIGPQVPAAEEKPTYRTVTVTPNPANSQIVVTGCTVAGENQPSHTATVTKNAENYTFDWGYEERPDVTLTYTGMGGGTQVYQVPYWSIDLTPPTFNAKAISLLTKSTPVQLEALLRAGVSNYYDEQTPAPDAITIDISKVNLTLAGDYTATITAKDGVGNTTTKDVAVKVENPPVVITKPTATPSGDDASTSRTFSAGITEPGGQTFTERGFVLGFGPAPTVESCVKKITGTGTDTSFAATEGSLLANVQYYVRTFATNGKGETYYSDALAFSCGAPGDYGALTADDVLAEILTGETTVNAIVTVKRTAGGVGTVTLDYAVAPGTLTTVSAASGKLTFAAGEMEKTISIPITDAAAFNEVKNFQVKLTNPTPTTINGSESVAVTVGYSTANKTKLDPPGASSGCLLPSGVYTDSRVNDVAIFPHGGYLKNLPTQTITIPGIGTTYEKRGSIPMEQANMPTNWRFEEGAGYTAPFLTNGATQNDPSQFHSDNPETLTRIPNTVALTATVDVSGCRGHAYAAGFQTNSMQGTPEIEVRFFDGSSNMIDAPTGTTTFTRKVGYDYLVEYPCVDAVERLCSCTGADVVTAGAMGSSDRTIPSNAQTAEVTFRIVEGYKKSLYNFYFGTKEMPQLSFTRFDTDIAAGRTYYPGDQIRIYPVLNSAIEPLTTAATISVNGAAIAYVPAQKAFVYTVPATGATSNLTVTHNGVTYTVQDETSGAAWSKSAPTGAAGTFSYTLGGMPSIAIAGATTGQNTAHSATVTATGGTAYYVWATSATPPSGGWTQIPVGGKISGSGYAATMYLHAKVTNVDGKTVYANQPFTFVAPSVFEVDASPSGWQKSAAATLTRTPANGTTLTVKVSRGGGTAEEVTGNSYPITESGVYTFTATDTYGFSKTVVRSYSIDAVAPTITVNADSYTENYLYQQLAGITATAKDTGGSELNALEYAWSTNAIAPAGGFATVLGGGVIPAQSAAGTWHLHLKATDKAGNETAEQKGPYLVAATAPAPPTVAVTRAGNTGSYTVSQGANTLSMIIAPDKEGYAATPISGSFNITKNGRYTVIAYDSQGIRADASVIVNDIDTDAPNIESSVWNGVSEVVYGTYVNADKLTVKVRVDDKLTPTYDANGDIRDYFGTGATSFSWKKSDGGEQSVNLSGENGSFEITENGTYEITAADAQGNPTTERVLVKSIDNTAPTLTVTGAVPNPDTWYQAEQTVSFTAADADSGVASVTLQKNDETANPLTAASGTYSAVTSGSGSYTITATDNVGLTATKTFTVKIDTVPVVKIAAKTAGGADYTAGTTATGPVTLTISNAAIGSAVTKYEWKLAGESVWKTLALSDPTTTFEKSGTYNCVFHMTNTKGVSAEESFSVVIDLPDITGITVTPYTGVYDGAAHPIVTVSGTLPGDKVFYTIPSGSPTETVPMVTKVADNKSVMVKVTRANHTDYAPADWFAAMVTQKEVAVAFTVPQNLVYDGTDKTVTAEITNKIGADDLSLTLGNATGKAVGKYITTVTALSGTAAGNYKLPSSAPSVAWEITGTPYPGEIILPTASGITYGQKLSDSTLTGNNGGTGVFTWNDNTIVPPAGSYTATVVFTPTDTNFAPVTRTVQVAVAKAEVTLAVSGTKTYHTTPIANADFVVSNITGMVNGETDNALLGTLALTSAGNTKTAAVGSYDITIAQGGTSNYTVTTETIVGGFTVTHAAQMLTGTASYTKLLTDKDFAPDVKTDNTDADAAVVYTLTNDGGGAVMLDADGKTVRMKKPGTATITANGLQTANFEAADPLTITVTIGSMPSVRALATEDITTTEAKIGGVVTVGTIPMTGYGLEYKKASEAGYTPVSPSETDNGSAKTLTHSLVGLEKDTEYTVRVWAKTADKTFESVTRFRTAAEQPPTGKVEGEITDESGTNTAITVTIEAGNTVIASHTVKAGGGKFTFEALPDGFYNLVADNGKYKVTRMVEIVKGGAVTDVKMEIGRTQSVVEIVTPDTPNVAVDGLPELFQNDTLFTDDNKAVITAGGTVEFKLTVEKKDAPTDAEEIDKIAEGKVGVYLDIGLQKTVIDQNGRAEAAEAITNLGTNEITIVIPLTKELQGKESYTVYRVHDGAAEKLESDYSTEQNTLTIKSSLFSTYAIAYTEKSGGGGGSDGNSHDDDNYDFWQKVKDKIGSAEDGDTVKAGAGSYDKMPESVMDALRKNPGVTLEITWNGGDKITIPAGGALEKDGLRIYYPLAYLAELFAKGSTPAPEKNHINPETGGVWEVNAPITAAQTPAIPTPKNEGTAATPEQAHVERAAIEPPTAPEITAIPDIAEVADGTPNHSKAMLFTGIVIMLAAAAVACGVILWKKKNEEEQTNEK